MRRDAETYFSSTRGKMALLAGVFIAPLMFLTDQLVTYTFVPWACSVAGMIPLYTMAAGSMLVAAAGFWISRRNWNWAGKTFSFELGGPIGRSRFVSFVGMLFSGLFFVAILAMAVPDWIMNACHP